ncbi:Urea transporter [Pandoraea commovens]|uniref:Urea transporter n=2 Tax=Pandoraea commovens TaxID=2508289 RepID=A0A5E4VN64_9BURK|nr:Urea transporter [Pandoraea commovens]
MSAMTRQTVVDYALVIRLARSIATLMSLPRPSSVPASLSSMTTPSSTAQQHRLIGELRGTMANFAQIYFIPSAGIGALLLAVLALSDLAAALTGLAASITASGVAIAMRLPHAQRHTGLFGYNGALTGIAFGALWQPDGVFAAWLVVCVALTVMATATLARRELPALTGPFVAVMALSWAMLPWLELSPRMGSLACDVGSPGFVFCSVGQVVFVAPLVLGLLMWYLLALWNARATVWALAAGVTVWVILVVLASRWPSMAAQAGGVGINAFLAALGLGVFGRRLTMRLTGAALAAVICVILGGWLTPRGWPYFTLPFNLAVWIVLGVTARDRQGRRAGDA